MKIGRDFIFAEDIAKHIEYIINNMVYGTYDLATNITHSVYALIKIIEDTISNKISITDNKRNDIFCPTPNALISCKICHTKLKSGIKKTFDFYKKNNELIRSIIQ
jgi:dTDP-D-glucose 4,6-dehydratase